MVRLLFDGAPIVAWPAATEPPCGRTLGGPAIAGWMGANDSAAAATNTTARRNKWRVGRVKMILVLVNFYRRQKINVNIKSYVFTVETLLIWIKTAATERFLGL